MSSNETFKLSTFPHFFFLKWEFFNERIGFFVLRLEILAPDCGPDEISCDDKCHPSSIRCDGSAQCSDGYDEEDCGDRESPTTTEREWPEQAVYPSSPKPTVECPEWKCPGEEVCFGVADRCDGRWTCNSGYDESGCTRKRSSALQNPSSEWRRFNLK